MTSNTEDGGAAFPSEQGEDKFGNWNQTFEPGMSLRDWFAGQALNAFVQWALAEPVIDENDNADRAASRYAKAAYQMADAMLAQRKAPSDG